jgi:hypothetical protein
MEQRHYKARFTHLRSFGSITPGRSEESGETAARPRVCFRGLLTPEHRHEVAMDSLHQTADLYVNVSGCPASVPSWYRTVKSSRIKPRILHFAHYASPRRLYLNLYVAPKIRPLIDVLLMNWLFP